MITIKPIETIRTKRLTLREFHDEDANDLYNNWGKDKEITKYMLWKNYKSIEDAINTINYYKECYSNNSNFRQYAIEITSTHELIGQISFTLNKRHESAEIAYLISKNYQGKGYMYEALTSIIEYLFNEINCSRISAEVMIENTSSIKLLEKCNFKSEGIQKKKYKKHDGNFTDVITYAKVLESR